MSKQKDSKNERTPITKAEWDEQFEKLTSDMSEETSENGDSVFTVEGFHKWMEAIISMPDFPDD